MNTKKIPAIVSLLAGLISIIITYMKGTELQESLITLFIVLLSFYIFGSIVKAIVDYLTKEEPVEEETEEDGEVLENVETDESE